MSVEKDRREKKLNKFSQYFQDTCILIVFLGKVTQSPLIKAAYSLEKIFILIFMCMSELTSFFVA